MLLLTCLYASLTVLNRHYMRSQLASRYSLLWFKTTKYTWPKNLHTHCTNVPNSW